MAAPVPAGDIAWTETGQQAEGVGMAAPAPAGDIARPEIGEHGAGRRTIVDDILARPGIPAAPPRIGVRVHPSPVVGPLVRASPVRDLNWSGER